MELTPIGAFYNLFLKSLAVYCKLFMIAYGVTVTRLALHKKNVSEHNVPVNNVLNK